MSKTITVRIKKINRNGKDRFVIEKIVFKFLFVKLWKVMLHSIIKDKDGNRLPMEFERYDKAVKQLNNL